MTSQIVFMEHNPITMSKKPTSPSSLSSFVSGILLRPNISYERSGYSYTSTIGLRSFTLDISHGEVMFRGKWFRGGEQTDLDQYLFERGIAVKRGLVDLDEIRRRSYPGGALLIEEMKYDPDIKSPAISRAKSFLKVSVTNYSLSVTDAQFLSVSKGLLLHNRTKDPIPPNEWVPLYRPGSVFDPIPDDGPINLETTDHVIF